MAVYSSPKLHQAGAPPPPFFGFAALSKKENLVRRAKFRQFPIIADHLMAAVMGDAAHLGLEC